jgi:Tol biopolymer transport system component
MRKLILLPMIAGFALGCAPAAPAPEPAPAGPTLATIGARPFEARPDEPHLRNLRMLTNGGENAEAYFSADGRQLIFQATIPGVSRCDQIFTMNLDGTGARRVSNGKGRTTCAYFFPAGDRIVYASTHHVSEACPAPPDMRQGYVWALYEYDLFVAAADGSDIRQLTDSPGYDAEATVSRDGRRIVFTSVRDGDLDIYSMDADGSNVRRLTSELGYDGGPFYSFDGTKVIYRAHHPESPEQIADYQRLLAAGLVRPSTLDIWIMDADGANKRRITRQAAANFAPCMHPDGRRIIFSSNQHDPRGRDFDLYLVDLDGTGLERVTTAPDFDGFPMFSADGRRLVFASNRGAARPGETNIFLADWVD